MALTTYKWSVNRYHQAIAAGIFDGQPVELLCGELILMAPEREPHAYYNSEVGDYLRGLLGRRAKVREAHPVTLGEDSEPCPDLAICRPLGREYLEHHPYPGDIFWLVEFSNTTLAKDLTAKKRIYARAGIEEYWVVNLSERQLHCFVRPRDGDYEGIQILTDGVITPVSFPELAIEVRRLVEPS